MATRSRLGLEEGNPKKSKVLAGVEHILGHHEAMGGKLLRTVGLNRVSCKSATTDLVYKLCRFA